MNKSPWRALIVMAHPDDMEFSCAGTLAKWADAGAEVTLCIATDGSTGTQDPDLMGDRLASLRWEETRRAAEVVGLHEVVWLGYRDGYVEYSLELRKDIARVFRTYRPHRFMVLDPASTIEGFINHPDHRAVGQASLDVSMTAGTTPGHFPELLDEGVPPWRGLRELWIAGPGKRSVAVDITATLERKIEALSCHQSQVGENAEEIAEWVRTWSRDLGEPHGYAHAETFEVLSQGPGFHEGEQDDEVEGDLAAPPLDPRSSPT
ncbi:MAG: PIG-L family deacetylase [Actinomycetota bacterium]|nr:PIG-L family deacetylase [Actinomycetota bacterium]